MIWIVSDHDYDNNWVVAVYSNEALAKEHVALMGDYIETAEMRSILHPDTTKNPPQPSPCKEGEDACSVR